MAKNANGFSNKELIIKVWEDVSKVDKKVDDLHKTVGEVLDDHEQRISTVQGELAVYKTDRKWALGIISLMVAAMIASISVTLQGCSQVPDTPIPFPTPIRVETPTITALPTVTPTPTPTATKVPEYTPEPTRDYRATPTQILSLTAIPPIVEVTPIGGQSSNWQVLPSGTMFRVTATILKVRSCASTSCGLLDRYAAGKEVEVIARWRIKTVTDQWLCLVDLKTVNNVVMCPRAIAYIYNDQVLGELLWPEVDNED